MKRLKNIFAIILLLFFFPIWRNADLVAIFSPWDLPLTLNLTFTFAVFLATPVKLFFSKIRTSILISTIIIFGIMAHLARPVSTAETKDPGANHCGGLTWAGVFYSGRSIFPEVYIDDLEARNQLCWLRKMINQVPPDMKSSGELSHAVNSMRENLLRPEMKYRAALPLIALLQFQILKNFQPNENISEFSDGKFFLESLEFWQSHYTVLLSERKYGAGSFPHSEWVKFEYGLIEKNWDSIVSGLKVESN